MRVLGIDPGLRATGIALLCDNEWMIKTVRPVNGSIYERFSQVRSGVLSVCGDVKIDLCVIEHMQIYQKTIGKNGLIRTAMLSGFVAGVVRAEEFIFPFPREWTNGVPKHTRQQRLKQFLPDIGKESQDAWDAIGLALWGAFKKSKGG